MTVPDPILWRRLAACRNHPAHWWHTDDRTDPADTTRAVTICRTCPSRPGCLTDAAQQHAVGVVRGGLSGVALRRELVRRRRTMPQPRPADANRHEARRLNRAGWDAAAIAGRLGVSVRVVYRYLSQSTSAA